MQAEIRQTYYHPVRGAWEEDVIGTLEIVDGRLEYYGDSRFDPRPIKVPVWDGEAVRYVTADDEPELWLTHLSEEFRYSFSLEVS